jgi:DNA (cytosine-5)-methyltransferase 1
VGLRECGIEMRSSECRSRDPRAFGRRCYQRHIQVTCHNAPDQLAGKLANELAALNAGIDVRAALDNDRHAGATFKRNIVEKAKSDIEFLTADIRDVDWHSLLTKARLGEGECDILLGGPPCQGFSTHRIKGAGVGDSRNELLLEYLTGLKVIRPRAFLVENVTGILWPRHERYLSRFLNGCRSAGYLVFSPIVLNARDYGVPQNRKRVFFLGLRDDLDVRIEWPPARTHFNPDSDDVRVDGRDPWNTAAMVFDKSLRSNDPNAIHLKHSVELRDVFKNTPKNGGSRAQSNRVLRCHRDHNGHKDVYGRINPRKPGPTMTTGCVNPSKGRFVHPTANHAITARHAARFQTFPEHFVFEGGLMAAAKQIGNAVPVLLGEQLVFSISRALAICEVRLTSVAS